MRLAVIADMHGNSHALEAILADAERVGVDAMAFLGDFVSDCADPEGVLALAREAARAYPCWAVRGNREEYQVRYAEGQEAWRADSRTGSLLYTAQRLSAADIAYFRRLPRSLGLSVDERPGILLCHGSPWATRDLLTPGSALLEQALSHAAQAGHALLLLGHCHVPFVLRKGGVLAVNPGAAGLPEDGDPRACWALATCEKGEWSAQLMRVKYDIAGAVRQMEERGLADMAPWWARCIAHTMRTGICLNMQLLSRAQALQAQRDCDLEICFAQAGKELEL